MAIAPCPHCGQSVGEDEPVCPSCGKRRDESPAPPPAAAPAPPSRGGAFLGFLAAAALGAAAYAAWPHLAGRAAPPRSAAAPVLAPAPAASATANAGAETSAPAAPAPRPEPTVPASTETARPEDEEAELPPVPRNVHPGSLVVYGVAYDLATKRPVNKARVNFSWAGGAVGSATDAHGWFGVDIPFGVLNAGKITARVSAPRYKPGALEESDVPLASGSDARRRAVAEESPDRLGPIQFTAVETRPLLELDLVLVPLAWPAGMPAADFADAVDPPIPDEPDERTCRYYGVVYDLATKKPLRRLSLQFEKTPSPRKVLTDGLGRYVLDVPVFALDQEPTVTASAADYRPGLMPERDPAMRSFPAKQRRGIADVSDLSFDPAALPGDCDEGLVRFDLAAVPLRWPGK